MSENSKFSVCAIVREENAILDVFTRFYLHAGAEYIYLYIDGPDPEFINPDPMRVKVRRVDEFNVGQNGTDPLPIDLNLKQRAIYGICFQECSSAWMLFVDADEFLTGPDTIEALLDHVPSDVEVLSVKNVEAVWGPGDDPDEMFGCSYFRSAMSPRQEFLKFLLYGKHSPIFRQGLLGHSSGKSFVRCGTKYDQLGAHKPARNGKRIGTYAQTIDPKLGHYLVAHYDAISFQRWRAKWKIRIDGTITATGMGDTRLMQMQQIAKGLTDGEAASRALFTKFYGLTWFQAHLLKMLHGLIRMRPLAHIGHGIPK